MPDNVIVMDGECPAAPPCHPLQHSLNIVTLRCNLCGISQADIRRQHLLAGHGVKPLVVDVVDNPEPPVKPAIDQHLPLPIKPSDFVYPLKPSDFVYNGLKVYGFTNFFHRTTEPDAVVEPPCTSSQDENEARGFPEPGTREWGEMNRERAALLWKRLAGQATTEETDRLIYLQRMSLEALERQYPRGQ